MSALPSVRGALRDALSTCLTAVKRWWDLPVSAGRPKDKKLEIMHRGKPVLVPVVGLTDDLVGQLWDSVPWEHEVVALKELFGAIPVAEAELRNAAHHLLWYVAELSMDREPLSADKLHQ